MLSEVAEVALDELAAKPSRDIAEIPALTPVVQRKTNTSVLLVMVNFLVE